MAHLSKSTDMRFNKKGAAPGKTILVKTKAAGDQERELEMYHSPGICSAPTDNEQTVSVQVGTGSRIIIASHNYNIEIEPAKGETIIYSTDENGENVKAKITFENDGNITLENDNGSIKLNTDGKIDLNGSTDNAVSFADLKTVVEELQNDLTTIKAVFSGWVIAPTDGGAALKAAAATWYGTPITGNMDSAKVDDVRVT